MRLKNQIFLQIAPLNNDWLIDSAQCFVWRMLNVIHSHFSVLLLQLLLHKVVDSTCEHLILTLSRCYTIASSACTFPLTSWFFWLKSNKWFTISERLFERSSPSLAHWSDALTVFFSEIMLYETVTGGTQLWLSLNLKSCSSYHTRTNKHIHPKCIILQCIIKTAPETSQSKQPNIWRSMSLWIYQNGNPLTVHMHLLL